MDAASPAAADFEEIGASAPQRERCGLIEKTPVECRAKTSKKWEKMGSHSVSKKA
jgi:hypothetical protein